MSVPRSSNMLKTTLVFATLSLCLTSVGCHLNTDTRNVTAKTNLRLTTHDPIRPDMHLYEQFLKKLTKAAVKKALPIMYRVMGNVNISSGCVSSLMKYAVALRQIKVWAMRMFDATAKVPSGMLDGTVTEFGAFDQCLSILVKNKKGQEDFRGQYCSVEAIPRLGPRPANLSLARKRNTAFDDSIMRELDSVIFAFYQLTLRFGICVPSTCSADDMQALASQVTKPFNSKIQVSKCHTKQELQVEVVHIVVLLCIGLLILFLCGGTALEWYMKRRRDNGKKSTKLNVFQKVLMAFSVTSNTQKLLSSVSQTDEMKSLHGIRALSMTWVVLGHTYIWVNFQALSKATAGRDWFNNIEFEAILNGWLSVSSFIFLSGLLTTYTTLQYMSKTGGEMNIFLYIFRRFLRLYPSVLLLLGAMFFLPWVASGPFWSEIPGVELNNCRRSWWANLAFINNWRPINEMCMQHSWYISADMQLHIIALLVLIPLHRNMCAGLIIACSLALGGSLTVGIITYINNYDPTILISTANMPQVYRIAEEIHVKTFTYLGPYCVGIGTGYLLIRNQKPKMRLGFKAIGWCAACMVGFFSLYGTHWWNTGNFPNREVTATYAALHRTTFSLALAWVAYLCVTRNADMISHILKFHPFILMSRLTFMTYLAQGPVIWTRYGSLKEKMFYSHYNMLYEYLGNLAISLAVAFAGHLLVEAPFANLERLLFATIKTPARENSSQVLYQVQTKVETEIFDQNRQKVDQIEKFQDT